MFTIDKNRVSDVGFPLPLFLDEVYDFMRVWAAYVSCVPIDLGEELGDF